MNVLQDNNAPYHTVQTTHALSLRVQDFQNTEIGLIPRDWEVRSFEKVFDFMSTASYSREQLGNNANVGYVHYGDIHTKYHFFIDLTKANLPTITESQVKNYTFLEEGDLIMADASEDYSGIGKCVEVRNLGDRKVIAGLHTFLLRPKKGIFANGFKGYLQSNHLVKQQLDRLATGLKVYGISKNNLKQILIPLPPLPEQARIAEILQDQDALISRQEEAIEKQKMLKQATMQTLLQPKEGWEERRLGDCLDLLTDFEANGSFESVAKNVTIYDNQNFAWYVRATDLEKSFDTLKIKFVDEKSYKFLHKTRLFGGEVLLTKRGEIGKVYLFDKKSIRYATLAPNLYLLNLNEEIALTYYIYAFFQSPLGLKSLLSNNASSTLGALYKNDVKNIKIPLPPLAEQTRIATILSDIDAEIGAMEAEVQKQRALKEGLMQELLTGKRRLL